MAPLLVATDDGLVEVAADGEATTHLEGHRIGAVASDATGRWAVVDGVELWHAGPEPTDWGPQGQAPGDQRLTCLLPVPGGLLVGTAGAHLLRLGDRTGLERLDDFDHLETRGEWYTPWGGPPDTRWLDADDEGGVFVAVHVGGIVASTDGGRSWRQTSLDVHADVHQVLAGAAPGVVLSPCAEGLAVSQDGGDTWRIDDEGLHASYCRAATVAGDTVVLSASNGPRGERSALYRRPLQGDGAFERCRTGLPEWFDDNVDTGCLASAGDSVVATAGGGQVFRSEDRGDTWRLLVDGLSTIHSLTLA